MSTRIHDWLMGRVTEIPYYDFIVAKFNQMTWPVKAAEEQDFKERITGKLSYDN